MLKHQERKRAQSYSGPEGKAQDIGVEKLSTIKKRTKQENYKADDADYQRRLTKLRYVRSFE
jgi:hypothetical protein